MKLLPYLLLAELTLAIMGWLGRLQLDSLAIPWAYDGDALLHQLWLKTHIELGWFSFNPRFGVPGGMDLSDFPQADLGHYLILWPIGQLTRDPFLTFNIYFALGMVGATWSLAWVLRRLGVNWLLAGGAALVFAHLPFHYYRMAHFFIASYFWIPLSGWLAIVYLQGGTVRTRTMLIIAIGSGIFGVYYAYFACFFWVLAGLVAALREKRLAYFSRVFIPCAICLTGVAVALAPAVLAKRSQPFNPDAIYRNAGESEVLGLKFTHLILPVKGHRSQKLSQLRDRYDAHAPLNNENFNTSLGACTSLAFLFVFFRFILGMNIRRGDTITPLDASGLFCLGGFLLGTIGGVGAWIALLATPWIRGYNRISIWLAMFAILGLAWFLQQYWPRRRDRQWLAGGLLLGLTGLSLWEQTNPQMMPRLYEIQRRHMHDRDFVADIEKTIEPGGLIYQFPYRPFPEADGEPAGITFTWYDHLRPQLHSQSARWTFGTLRGRYGDVWSKRLERIPLEERMNYLIDAGCQGLLLNRKATKDNGQEWENIIFQQLQVTPKINFPRDLVFYSLKEKVARRQAELGDKWEEVHRRAAYPVLPLMGAGSGMEFENDFGFARLCKNGTELWLVNPSDKPRRVWLKLEARLTAKQEDCTLTLEGVPENPTINLEDTPIKLEHSLVAPPGRFRLTLKCQTEGNRSSYFEIINPEVIEDLSFNP